MNVCGEEGNLVTHILDRFKTSCRPSTVHGLKVITLDLVYNEFGYYVQPALTNKLFSQKGTLLIDIND